MLFESLVMNTALLSAHAPDSFGLARVSHLLAPLQDLWRWLTPRITSRVRPSTMGAAALRGDAPSLPCRRAYERSSPACPNQPHRALRVLRVMDGSANAQGLGRMRISGRMADVCAELDRLAAREAALQ